MARLDQQYDAARSAQRPEGTKQLLGQTPLEYATEWRMQKALVLLKQEERKLLEVALSVGYESDAAFSKAFKRVVGITPGEYRQGAVS